MSSRIARTTSHLPSSRGFIILKKATLKNRGRKFNGEHIVMKSRPAEATNYESSVRNKGDRFDDGNNRHETDRVWGLCSIPRKKKGAKVTQKVKMRMVPVQATKDRLRKRRSTKAAEGSLLNSFYKDNEYEIAKSS